MPQSEASASENLRKRLASLAQQHSQSEIARRTGTLVSNVNRYIRGTKIPGEFLAGLVSGLGVNPAWLLSGEGAVYASDAASSSSGTATELLGLVSAMNAVAKMRLGSLAGKHHLRILRELNEALSEYDRIRENLNNHSRGVFEHLIRDFEAAIMKRNLDQAEDLRKTADSISRLCHDRDLARRFSSLNVYYEWQFGSTDRASRLMHDQFLGNLPASGLLDENSAEDALHLALTLYTTRRIDAARRIARAAIELLPPEASRWSAFVPLQITAAAMDIELGELKRGMARLTEVYSASDLSQREEAGGLLLRCLLLSGFNTFEQAHALTGASRAKSRHLLLFAIWLEDARALKEAQQRYVGRSPERVEEASLEAIQCRALALALNSKGKPALDGFNKEAPAAKTWPNPEQAASFTRAVFQTQLARLGNSPEAARYLAIAEELLAQTPGELAQDLLIRALHYRNVLKIAAAKPRGSAADALAGRARDFFAMHCERGYRCFAAPLK